LQSDAVVGRVADLVSLGAMHSAIAILLAAMAAVAPVPAHDDDQEIVIADSVDFGFPVAVYVDASRALRLKMQEAVAHAVTSGMLKCTHSKCSWAVHADRLRYFGGINGAGASVRSGLACPNDWGIPKQRFYKVYALEHMVGCLELSWDEDLGQYDVFEAPNGT
jgi:hypothetical protein